MGAVSIGQHGAASDRHPEPAHPTAQSQRAGSQRTPQHITSPDREQLHREDQRAHRRDRPLTPRAISQKQPSPRRATCRNNPRSASCGGRGPSNLSETTLAQQVAGGGGRLLVFTHHSATPVPQARRDRQHCFAPGLQNPSKIIMLNTKLCTQGVGASNLSATLREGSNDCIYMPAIDRSLCFVYTCRRLIDLSNDGIACVVTVIYPSPSLHPAITPSRSIILVAVCISNHHCLMHRPSC